MSHQNFQYDINQFQACYNFILPKNKKKKQRRRGIERKHWLKINYYYTEMK